MSLCSNLPPKRRFSPQPVETLRRSNRDAHVTLGPFPVEPFDSTKTSNRNITTGSQSVSDIVIGKDGQGSTSKPRFVVEPVETSRRSNYTTETAKSRFAPQPIETSRRTSNMAPEIVKPRFSLMPIETSKHSSRRQNNDADENAPTTPTRLTAQALTSFLSSLPQPISTTRYSNRDGPQRFSDRESEGCPSLSTSPLSTTSTTSCSTLSVATAPNDFLPSRNFSAFPDNSNQINDGDGNKRKNADASLSKEALFQQQPLAIRANTREFPGRDSSFDNVVRSHVINQQHDQFQQHFQEQQAQHLRQKQRQVEQHQNHLQTQSSFQPSQQRSQAQRPFQLSPPLSRSDVEKTPKKKKPLVPFSFIGSRNPVMMLDIKNQVLNSPLPTTRYYESSKRIDGDYFSSKLAEPTTPSSLMSRSTSATSSSNDTTITVPPIAEESKDEVCEVEELFTEPESDVDPNLCPSCRSEVTTEFVQMVFTYASLNHEAIGKKFDDELAIGTTWSLERVKADRFEALREYIGGYVDIKPHVVAGQGCW